MPFNQLAYKLINMMPFNGYENYFIHWLTMYTPLACGTLRFLTNRVGP